MTPTLDQAAAMLAVMLIGCTRKREREQALRTFARGINPADAGFLFGVLYLRLETLNPSHKLGPSLSRDGSAAPASKPGFPLAGAVSDLPGEDA